MMRKDPNGRIPSKVKKTVWGIEVPLHPFLIRMGVANQIPTQLYNQIIALHDEAFGPDTSLAAVFSENSDAAAVLAIRPDGTVIGCLWYRFSSSPRPFLQIHQIFVDKRWQRHGVGSAMMRALLSRYKCPVGLQAWTHADDGETPASRLCEEFGFRIDGEQTNPWALESRQGNPCNRCHGVCHCSAIIYIRPAHYAGGACGGSDRCVEQALHHDLMGKGVQHE